MVTAVKRLGKIMSRDCAGTAQVVIGAFVLAPSGLDKFGRSEIVKGESQQTTVYLPTATLHPMFSSTFIQPQKIS